MREALEDVKEGQIVASVVPKPVAPKPFAKVAIKAEDDMQQDKSDDEKSGGGDYNGAAPPANKKESGDSSDDEPGRTKKGFADYQMYREQQRAFQAGFNPQMPKWHPKERKLKNDKWRWKPW